MHCTARAANEFRLLVWGDLIMQAAKSALFVAKTHVELERVRVQSVFFEFVAAPGAPEEPPLIFDALDAHHEGTLQSCLDEFHSVTDRCRRSAIPRYAEGNGGRR